MKPIVFLLFVVGIGLAIIAYTSGIIPSDLGLSPTPTPTMTPTQAPTPTPTATPQTGWYYPLANEDDGYVSKTGPSYPPATPGAIITNYTTFSAVKSNTSNTVTVGLIRFDTSALPDAATLVSASLRLKISAIYQTSARALHGEWYSTANWPISIGDWIIDVPSTAFQPVLLNQFTAGYWIEIPLESITNINKAGMTGFRLGISDNAASVAYEVQIYAFDSGQVAELIVRFQ